MRGIVGGINDSIYLKFELPGLDNRSAMPLSQKISVFKAWAKVVEDSDFKIKGTHYLSYADTSNTVVLVFQEDRSFPLTKISVQVPNKDRYEVSELFLEGYFDFVKIDVPSKNKTVKGLEINSAILKGDKRINIMNKVYLERVGDPAIFLTKVATSVGEIVRQKTSSTIEI